jgi:hypothetical protein
MTDIRHEIELVTPGLNFLEDQGAGAKSVIERTKKILHEAVDRIDELEKKLELAIEMRLTQKLYFKERTPDLLINSKMCEAAFDRAMVENKND